MAVSIFDEDLFSAGVIDTACGRADRVQPSVHAGPGQRVPRNATPEITGKVGDVLARRPVTQWYVAPLGEPAMPS